MKFNKNNLKNIIFGHIVIFIIFVGVFQDYTGLERIIITILLDNKGPFSDYLQYLKPKYENFDLIPAGEMAEDKGNSYASSKTENSDNVDYNDEDLDKILINDEKQGTDENEHLKQAGGGLEQLKNLIDMAKKESPYSDKKNDYTPAQAQRATFHLIDTVKQLKETMDGMMPLMKAGKNLMGLHNQMGGTEFTNAFK